jgi:hypothetical protein
MSESTGTAHERPSALSAFFSGAGTGMFNGALMLGIYVLVTLAVPQFHVLHLAWEAACATILSTGIFGGVMGVKRHFSGHSHESAAHEPRSATLIPVQGHAIAPQLDLAQSTEMETDRRSDWAERTGRGSDSQSRVQQILANGSMSDRDRAAALLAERERSTGASVTIH